MMSQPALAVWPLLFVLTLVGEILRYIIYLYYYYYYYYYYYSSIFSGLHLALWPHKHVVQNAGQCMLSKRSFGVETSA